MSCGKVLPTLPGIALQPGYQVAPARIARLLARCGPALAFLFLLIDPDIVRRCGLGRSAVADRRFRQIVARCRAALPRGRETSVEFFALGVGIKLRVDRARIAVELGLRNGNWLPLGRTLA